MLNQPIAVLGGGAQGHVAAACLSLVGENVNFYEHPQFKDAFKTVLENKTVEINNWRLERREIAKIHKATTDMEEAISDVKLIILPIPSFGQELFFNTMIPYLKDGQVVIIIPGNFGSLRLRKLLSEKAPERKVIISETNTTPCGARVTGPGMVRTVWGFGPWLGPESYVDMGPRKCRICALPAKDTDALEGFQKFYPVYSPVRNVLVVALNNQGVLMHPVGTILNAGRIEYANSHGEAFRLHYEGRTPSVQKVEEGVREEIGAIVSLLGGGETFWGKGYTKWFADYYIARPPGYSAADPKMLKSRYITEDVPYGLVPIAELGEKLGVATPLINAFIEIGSTINQEDYRKTGRTLETLGLDKLNKEQIIKYVEEGTDI